MASDPLYVLLRRAVDDDGKEGEVAFRKFKERAKTQKGKLFFLGENEDHPLMFVVEDQERQIEELTTRIAELELFIQQAQISPNKQRAASFQWSKYPELEDIAFKMKMEEGRSNIEIEDFILDHAPEARGNTTFVNQRFVQGRPSLRFGITVGHGSEPTSWKELWMIGTKEHADGWIQRVMRLGNGWAKFQQDGHVPKNWATLDPNKFITGQNRKTMREAFHTGKIKSAGAELEELIEAAGAKGITRADLKKQGVSVRRFEIEKQSIIFQIDGRYVHYSFGYLYPDHEAAREAMLKYQRLNGHEARLSVSGKETTLIE